MEVIMAVDMEDMVLVTMVDMADMVATDVDTDMVLVTMVDMADMVDTDVDTAMVCGEDKYSANFPLRAFIQKLPITNYLFKDFSSTDKESVPHICGE